MNINRRTVLAGAGSAVLATAFVSRARAAQFNYKYANNLPAAHPMNIRAKQLIEKVGGNLIGIVLNNINMSQDESYYYYSGYYHDYYAKNEEAEPPAGAKAEETKPAGEIKQKY